ncbi:hypothetical protein [Streptomyces sp. NPDC020362]
MLSAVDSGATTIDGSRTGALVRAGARFDHGRLFELGGVTAV